MLEINIKKNEELKQLTACVHLHRIKKDICYESPYIRLSSEIRKAIDTSKEEYILTITLSDCGDYDAYRDVKFETEEELARATAEAMNFLNDCKYAKVEWMGDFFQEYIAPFLDTLKV